MLNPKRLVRLALNRIGYDISKISSHPRSKFLGLRARPIRSIIDVGANVGQFAREAHALFPDATIYCFEPQPKVFRELSTWASNLGGRVEAHNVALGEKVGTMPMLAHTNFSPSSSFLKTTAISHKLFPVTEEQTSISVDLRTLDHVFDERTLDSETLIKLDVQGYEARVIRGGKRTLQRAHACILEVCIDPLYEEQSTFKEIFMLMDELGYRYAGNLEQSTAEDGHPIFLDAVFVNQLHTATRA